MSFRQMLPFLLLNIVVSAVVVLSILFWWDNRGENGVAGEPTVAALPEGVLPTPNIAAPPSGTVAPDATAAAAANEPVIHTVQAGETLNIISQEYDVSVDDIMLVNGMDNPNFIAVGQQLTIPVGGIPEPTVAPTETSVALPSPIPTEPAAAGSGGTITVAGVLDPGVLETEAVQLVNNGAQEQSLLGWKVRDEDSNVYTFGNVSIFGEGAGVFLHTRAGTDTVGDLHWGLGAPVWRSGEQLTLFDASEQVIATFVVP
ncbi:MAG: LysM peptidoglycan-binding domain-containing protein [Anaerolineae bacterium]|nr:LysM peptidoglycan-binding domain-containing protein [Anaerolineae bacterium]